MKKIIQTFPTVMLEAIIDNEEEINTKLCYEIKNLFNNKDTQKRALSQQWEDFVVSSDNHSTGYSNFTTDSKILFLQILKNMHLPQSLLVLAGAEIINKNLIPQTENLYYFLATLSMNLCQIYQKKTGLL